LDEDRGAVEIWHGSTLSAGDDTIEGCRLVVYPGRTIHDVLSEFAGTNVIKPTPEQRRQLVEFVGREYQAGRSLRELGELTGRSQTAIRPRPLDAAGVHRRGHRRAFD
jgi:hypothetical protein